MSEVASRNLRNDARGVLRRVEAGEDVTITVDGRPVAVLRPLARRPQRISRDEFVRLLEGNQADPALRDELRARARHDRRRRMALTRALADTSVFIARESARALDRAALPDELALSIVTVDVVHV